MLSARWRWAHPVANRQPFDAADDLVERGLAAERSLLVVIDRAKALHKAVVELFGRRALIQRCREHKQRNVSEPPAGAAARRGPQRNESGLRDA